MGRRFWRTPLGGGPPTPGTGSAMSVASLTTSGDVTVGDDLTVSGTATFAKDTASDPGLVVGDVVLTSVGVGSATVQAGTSAAGQYASLIAGKDADEWVALQWVVDTSLADLTTASATKSLRLQAAGGPLRFGTSGSQIGAFGATPIAKPTVSGSKVSGAALTSLLGALSNLGWITDSTSA